MRRVRLLVVALLMGGMMAGVSAPASAQGYEGWIDHPYPDVGYWWCEYDEAGKYWCMAPDMLTGEWSWFGAHPDWYDNTVASMARSGLSPS
jgi:hypothetical protein